MARQKSRKEGKIKQRRDQRVAGAGGKKKKGWAVASKAATKRPRKQLASKAAPRKGRTPDKGAHARTRSCCGAYAGCASLPHSKPYRAPHADSDNETDWAEVKLIDDLIDAAAPPAKALTKWTPAKVQALLQKVQPEADISEVRAPIRLQFFYLFIFPFVQATAATPRSMKALRRHNSTRPN